MRRRVVAPSGRFLISFCTSQFDVGAEPPNEINPIPGHSFLAWLKPRLEHAGYRVDGPSTEDWGWYVEVNDGAGHRSIVGASARAEEGDPIEWLVQVFRWRTLLQWLRREPVMSRDDPLLCRVESLVSTLEFSDVDVEEQPAIRRIW